MSEPITVTIAKDLEDLIPTFIKNRAKELETCAPSLPPAISSRCASSATG